MHFYLFVQLLLQSYQIMTRCISHMFYDDSLLLPCSTHSSSISDEFVAVSYKILQFDWFLLLINSMIISLDRLTGGNQIGGDLLHGQSVINR